MGCFKDNFKYFLICVFVIYLLIFFLVDFYNVEMHHPTVRPYSAEKDPDIESTDLTPSITETTEPVQGETTETTEDGGNTTTTETTSTVPTTEPETLIGDGTSSPTTDDGAPYLAAVIHDNGFLIGSGAVVGDRWIVVTTFQMGAFKAEHLNVRVGSQSAISGGQLLSVSDLYPHPMFKQFNNDVALLRTAVAIRLGSSVWPIPVARSPPNMGQQAVLVTWDRRGDLLKRQADVLPVSECRAFYPDYELTESNICVVTDHILPYRVSLYGSPLVWNHSLVGLYMGIEADVFKPALCSSLSPLTNWIRLMIANATDTLRLFPLT